MTAQANANMPNSDTGPELSIIVPTFNERANLAPLVESLKTVLHELRWEVIFVDDDSPDGTADAARELAQTNRRVRCVQRLGRRGLSSACVEGMLASSAPFMAVIDGDRQHDETRLTEMLKILQTTDKDIVVGSRYAEGGGIGEWDSSRASISKFATTLSRMVIKAPLTDPMSGFFMLRRETLDLVVRKLSSLGFKILVDMFASAPRPLKYAEVPYQFRNRTAGESKLDSRIAWDYGMLLLDKLIGHVIPVRFLAFTMVGTLGVAVHMVVLGLAFQLMHIGFAVSQTIAALVAMTGNYALNNALTYRDMRLRGWQWLRGWISFTVACSVGMFANVGIASYIYDRNSAWLLAALSGIVVGAVWNYAVTSVYTWRHKK